MNWGIMVTRWSVRVDPVLWDDVKARLNSQENRRPRVTMSSIIEVALRRWVSECAPITELITAEELGDTKSPRVPVRGRNRPIDPSDDNDDNDDFVAAKAKVRLSSGRRVADASVQTPYVPARERFAPKSLSISASVKSDVLATARAMAAYRKSMHLAPGTLAHPALVVQSALRDWLRENPQKK